MVYPCGVMGRGASGGAMITMPWIWFIPLHSMHLRMVDLA